MGLVNKQDPVEMNPTLKKTQLMPGLSPAKQRVCMCAIPICTWELGGHQTWVSSSLQQEVALRALFVGVPAKKTVLP